MGNSAVASPSASRWMTGGLLEAEAVEVEQHAPAARLRERLQSLTNLVAELGRRLVVPYLLRPGRVPLGIRLQLDLRPAPPSADLVHHDAVCDPP